MEEAKKPDMYAVKQKIDDNDRLSVVVAKKERKPRKLMKVKNLEGLVTHEKNKAKFEDRALMCLGHPYIIQIY